jgi:1-deoxy-D-xylulose-5-phosphate synthase
MRRCEVNLRIGGFTGIAPLMGVGACMLSTIDEPRALRELGRAELAQVARELREHLIELGAEVGGHFAGSLGAVELTVALHTVFDTRTTGSSGTSAIRPTATRRSPGRREALRRIKRADGPAGFLRRCESPYDVFGAGHAGTSISPRSGSPRPLRAPGSRRQAVAVIGDGAATAGMSFEALNHAGHLRAALRVVFNDNGMSIAPNVGGLHRTGDVAGYARALGIAYHGPVDGHDLDALLDALAALRDAQGPALLHVKTQKGRGYEPAEADPYRWHATVPFDRARGVRRAGSGGGPPSWTAAFADALARLADRDPRVVALTAAMPDGTGLDKFAERHPDRMYDVGIAEQHAVTFAAGLASEGLRPVCAIYSSFLQRGFDQIMHDVALQQLPVTFALDRAGWSARTAHAPRRARPRLSAPIPNLVIAAPRDENELQHLLATAVESGAPFALRFPRGAATGCALDPDPKPLPIGRGELLRDGSDLAIAALGKTVPAALAAADALAREGISAAVVDARFVKPLDARSSAGSRSGSAWS